MSLDRFHAAQASRWSGYEVALGEIHRGHKSSHWIWYIFPQIAGLGRSSAARDYALRDFAEACDYLCDPVLRHHYEEISAAIREQVEGGVPIQALMGSSIDALKLASSLTLFRAVAQHLVMEDESLSQLVQVCDSLLRQAAAQGYPACTFTLSCLPH